MRNVAKALWARWTRVAHVIGTFQARLILTVLYVVLLPPFALISRRGSVPARRRGAPAWLVRAAGIPELDGGRRQFS